MMDEPVPVYIGDVLTGSVVLQRNPVWRRHMSVALSWSVTSGQDPTSQRVRYLAVESCAVGLVWGMVCGDHSGGCSSRPGLPPWPHLACILFLILTKGSGHSYFQNRKWRCRKVNGLFWDTASQ